MDIFIYVMSFILGTFIGSFCTLAVYRIPLGQDITHERSYCPNCNHKLSFLDLIPVFSYLLLKGKCRYCEKPIRIRYFLLEMLSGTIFLMFAFSLNIDLFNIEKAKLIYGLFGILYMTTLILIAGIDKDKNQISKGVLGFGIISTLIYIIYLYILEKTKIYSYVIYLLMMLALLILDTNLLRTRQKINYTIEILMLSILLIMFSGSEAFICTVSIALLITGISIIIKKILKKENKIPAIGFYLCIANLTVLIIQNYITNYTLI